MMGDTYHDQFMLTGRIPSKSKFFQNWRNLYTSEAGIYKGLNTVLGEQIVVPNKKARAPIYTRFLGEPMKRGDAWMERFVLGVPNPTHFTGKATAEDAFKWYDTTFSETVHKLNFAGTRSVSLSDDLMTNQLNNGESGAVNDYIVDFMTTAIQRELEYMAGVNLVMQIPNEAEVDLSTPEKIRDMINKIAIKMKESNVYAEDAYKKDDGSQYADEVVAIMPLSTAFTLTQQPAVYPNAGVIRTEAEVLPIYSNLPSGLTEAEYKKGAGDGKAYEYYSSSGSAANPPGLNRKSPDIILLDSKYLEIRPYLDKWRIDTCRNAKGEFTNVHAAYMGAMGIKPWRSAVCLRAKTTVAKVSPELET